MPCLHKHLTVLCAGGTRLAPPEAERRTAAWAKYPAALLRRKNETECIRRRGWKEIMKEKWMVSAKRADFKAIAQKFGIDQVTARIIRNRDVIGEEAVKEYLYGGLEALHGPELLRGCQEAVKLLEEKIRQGKRIRIIGDYDIDGVNSTFILYRALTRCGASVDYEIPDRMKDGFGMNQNLVSLAFEEGIDTILTCDNGIAALDQIDYAKECGMTVIVTDHHEPFFEDTAEGRIYRLPAADVIVNPKQPGCPYPYKKLCGGAVAWKLVCALYHAMGIPEHESMEFLEFAAIATVGDVMDLDGENRIIVKAGLKRLAGTSNPGLRALIAANGLTGAEISSYHIGFVLGPCLNASGRLDTAKRSLRLLLAETQEEAAKLAQELKALNDARKQMTQDGVEQACKMIDTTSLANDRVLVVYLPECHESIAGIVAGRLRERYYRPVFVVTDGEESAKGSGRSIEAYSMFEEMVKCQDLFMKFGGHPMAAGFSLERERIGEMRRRLNENCMLTEEDLTPKITIDVPMPIDYITEDLIEGLSVLEPFGKGNEKPLFAEKNLKLLSARILGKNRNVLKFQAANQTGTIMDALYFGDVEQFQEELVRIYGETEIQKLYLGRENRVHASVIYYPAVNEYQGRKTLQIVIKNYQVG